LRAEGGPLSTMLYVHILGSLSPARSSRATARQAPLSST